MKTAWLAGLLLALLHASASSAEPAPTSSPVTLGDLFSEEGVASASVSPSGRYIAAVVRRSDRDLVVVLDRREWQQQGAHENRPQGSRRTLGARITVVLWKSEERLLFRV